MRASLPDEVAEELRLLGPSGATITQLKGYVGNGATIKEVTAACHQLEREGRAKAKREPGEVATWTAK